MIKVKSKGDFKKTMTYFASLQNALKKVNFDKYGEEGVRALSAATPFRTGLTSESWYYTVEKQNGRVRISFNNRNIQNGVPIAIILQYGHGTRDGGWVEGRDYINPAIQPVFDSILESAWGEVKKL